ncbi:unnamed protein product [Tuber melanosporum]|uniref:(Perigord truffle) hypothetical protein n=1 Tax=Tuber melanosporum (strain Mel28) TaxID=656061 RepID=D5GL12_TUBMM|nr:uncharacterized protein GSTUM_00009905001 [Tuber melanosporum]CAZ85205.1 unnamed protein product [Tuber melanosporum]
MTYSSIQKICNNIGRTLVLGGDNLIDFNIKQNANYIIKKPNTSDSSSTKAESRLIQSKR